MSIKDYIYIAIICVATACGWVGHTWYDGYKEAKELKAQISAYSQKMDDFEKDQKATMQHAIDLGTKLDGYNNQFAQLHKEIGDEKTIFAKPAVAGCSNPFTPDFVRLLNGLLASGAPAATSSSGPAAVSGP